MPLVDNGVYVGGYRTEDPKRLEETYEVMRERKGMDWIGLYRPSETEVRSAADEFGLHGLAVDDALAGHQRAKLERYGETLFVVLRPARYVDIDERVEFGELHVFVGPDFVVTIRHAESPNLARVIKKISCWAAILFAPTLIGTIYGMNFDFMPELQRAWGYPFAVGLMVVMGGGLYVVFKSRKWL